MQERKYQNQPLFSLYYAGRDESKYPKSNRHCKVTSLNYLQNMEYLGCALAHHEIRRPFAGGMKCIPVFFLVWLTSCATPCNPGATALVPTPRLGEWGPETGRTPQDAVLIRNAINRHRLDETEEMWILSKCGRGKVLSRNVESADGRQIEAVEWHGIDARTQDSGSPKTQDTGHTTYFDITNAYQK